MNRFWLLFLLVGWTACAAAGDRPTVRPEPVAQPYPDIQPREWDYQKVYCNRRGWKVEVTLPDRTRADCLSPTHAIELDRVRKWKECLDQAEHYAQVTGKKPMCVLILDEAITPRLRGTIETEAARRGVALDWMETP